VSLVIFLAGHVLNLHDQTNITNDSCLKSGLATKKIL